MAAWRNPMGYLGPGDLPGYDRAIDTEFPEGFPLATIVFDCWPAQLKTTADGHQLCLAHLLRELNYRQEAFASG